MLIIKTRQVFKICILNNEIAYVRYMYTCIMHYRIAGNFRGGQIFLIFAEREN